MIYKDYELDELLKNSKELKPEFKVGDRVMVTKGKNKGRTGTIVNVKCNPNGG